MENRIISLINLCMKAGKLVSGEYACETNLKQGTAQLVVISEDASENTKKKFNNKAFFYKVPVVFYGQKAVLGKAVGKAGRSVLVITDAGFSKSLKELIEKFGEA